MKFVIIFVCLTLGNILACAQPDLRQIDPARIKQMDYPPLTVREGLHLELPRPPAEHPRLFIRKDLLPALRNKANHPLLKESWEKITASAALRADGKLRENVAHNPDTQIINAIEAKALLYVLTGDRPKGIEAVDMIFNLNNTLIINPDKADVCRDIGRVILSTALVYDWCYDLLAPAEKKDLIAIMESLATDMEVQWPYLKQGSVCGHGVEAQLARDMLSCAIAVYDEKPGIYQRVAGRIISEFIPAQNFWYPSGYHHQGSAYGPGRFQWEVYTMLLFDRMGYPGIVNKLQGQVPYYWIYTRLSDGQLLRNGDDYNELYMPFGKYWTLPALPYIASHYKDPVLMSESIRQGTIGNNPLFDLLLVDPEVLPSENRELLPLTRYFPSPYGGMVARTGWSEGVESNAVVAEMKVSEYSAVNHQHLDAGSFQLYYKGPLAVQSGVYQGTEGGYGSAHFTHYYQRTIGHNCLLVHNPEEQFTWHKREINNDGGQFFPGDAAEPRNLDALLNGNYKRAEVLAHGFGPDTEKPEYSYLKGDITPAYTNKVSTHKRSFVFLNLDNQQVPAALITYDHVASSDKNYKKTWLLHCVQEPFFQANTTRIIRNEKGYNGRLVNTTLLPVTENLNIEKIGGMGNEFSVAGINYPQQIIKEDNSGDGAIWRVEISPRQPSAEDCFLNVMQVMDNDDNILPLTVEKVETDRMTGVKIADRVVLFSKTSELERRPVSLVLKEKSNVLITDLEEGCWEVTSQDGKRIILNVSKGNNNLIHFEAMPGNYLIKKE